MRLFDDLPPDPARVADGWVRRSTADRPRARELIDLYRHLGFEVAADAVRAEDLPTGCDTCRLATMLEWRTIYTRLPAGRREQP